MPFKHLISENKKDQRFKIKTLNTKHVCWLAYKNKRATQETLTYYIKKKLQNYSKYKAIDMRKYLDDNLFTECKIFKDKEG